MVPEEKKAEIKLELLTLKADGKVTILCGRVSRTVGRRVLIRRQRL
ncbi:MAG: hypothetical protein M2R46_02488 [Verrucomicrobia subdivision 3 bacterium]|nr:hypothetical protein [Limisphaerales bacterium]